MMRKLKIWKNVDDDVGAIGIGAMIVFIAMIMVAGIAASVLVQTSNTVQIQAQQTGQQTIKEVASGISVFGIEGKVNVTGSTYYDLKYLAITVNPRPGSPDIDLNNTYILISDGKTKALLKYDYVNRTNVCNTNLEGNLFDSIEAPNWTYVDREFFGLGVLQDYDNSIKIATPVLNRGDKAVLFIRCENNGTNSTGLFSREIPERTNIFGRVIPEVGSPGVISFTSPMSYVDTIYRLQ